MIFKTDYLISVFFFVCLIWICFLKIDVVDETHVENNDAVDEAGVDNNHVEN